MSEEKKSTNQIANIARDKAIQWINSNNIGANAKEENKGQFKYVVAEIDNTKHYYIVKGREGDNKSFGAVTLTALEIVIEHDNCHFLLVNILKDDPYDVLEIGVDKMLKIMSIPPFKINFNIRDIDLFNHIDLSGKGVKRKDIVKLLEYYHKIKKRSIK